mmetsp:Transcript_43434/g.63805  ORF Transcript_43434/g.63805 Transcript_43434/m.63805 type:complete len:308 (+) Transcript_43434:72-995(+)
MSGYVGGMQGSYFSASDRAYASQQQHAPPMRGQLGSASSPAYSNQGGARTSYDDTHVHYGGAGATQLNASSYGARPGAAQPGMVQNAAGPATGANGADWRVQLADYASSRLKDEEMMRSQADLRAARTEIERLNNTVRQAQSRAAEDVRREQERLGSALRQTESSAEHQLRTLREAVKRRDEEYRRMWAEAMQRRDDEYRRMWADEKARVHQVVDEYRRRFEQDTTRLQEVVDEYRRRFTEESNLLKQMLDRSDHGANLSSAPLPTGMSTVPGMAQFNMNVGPYDSNQQQQFGNAQQNSQQMHVVPR